MCCSESRTSYRAVVDKHSNVHVFDADLLDIYGAKLLTKVSNYMSKLTHGNVDGDFFINSHFDYIVQLVESEITIYGTAQNESRLKTKEQLQAAREDESAMCYKAQRIKRPTSNMH